MNHWLRYTTSLHTRVMATQYAAAESALLSLISLFINTLLSIFAEPTLDPIYYNDDNVRHEPTHTRASLSICCWWNTVKILNASICENKFTVILWKKPPVKHTKSTVRAQSTDRKIRGAHGHTSHVHVYMERMVNGVKSPAGRNKAVDIDYVRANANIITITRCQRRWTKMEPFGGLADQRDTIYLPY